MLKRLFDLILACLLLVVLLPIMVLEALGIILESGWPCMFNQERIGLLGKPFLMYKFRTMLPPERCVSKDGKPVPESQRITRLGNFLRRASLDELPQVLNILLGQMSFVGPRPTLQYQVDRYTNFQRRRLEVKPGLTGLAQIKGRNNLTWEDKITLDVEYVSTQSFTLDLKIFFLTFGVLLKKDNIAFVKNDDISRLDK